MRALLSISLYRVFFFPSRTHPVPSHPLNPWSWVHDRRSSPRSFVHRPFGPFITVKPATYTREEGTLCSCLAVAYGRVTPSSCMLIRVMGRILTGTRAHSCIAFLFLSNSISALASLHKGIIVSVITKPVVPC
ncbi:hypothetical protein HD806DRAFT_322581 [Xylariaceae sp. AK1471]|nr:hypothetical protein HD806DRAFT_322581 [Xylariaceae sp. AK1471]